MQLTESEIHAIKQRVKKRIEEGLKRDEIMGIIKGLARSQGSYSRLYQFLRSGCDDAESMIQDLEDKCFNDAVDMIMYVEEGCQKRGKKSINEEYVWYGDMQPLKDIITACGELVNGKNESDLDDIDQKANADLYNWAMKVSNEAQEFLGCNADNVAIGE